MTPLHEWSNRRRNLNLKTHITHKRQNSIMPVDSKPQPQQASGRRPAPQTERPLEIWDSVFTTIELTTCCHTTTPILCALSFRCASLIINNINHTGTLSECYTFVQYYFHTLCSFRSIRPSSVRVYMYINGKGCY